MATSASASGIIPKPNLSQYVFSEKLGSGTYATVYKAYRKTGIREVVAIKCVLKSSLNKASTDNLLTEIEILKKLKHEYIVTLKDFHWDANYIYLVMEYCSGGDLSRFIRSKRALPEHVVKRFLQQIASAMKFLWDHSIAHMDLKPQNILLSSTSSPQIKLADFGFAKPLYDGDSLQVMRGSPLYMAPEIICQKRYDNRVDLWSIGVILYECLFGKAPFASKSYRELGEKIWDDKPVEIPLGFDISDNARDLILRLLKRDPAERIRFEEFFAHPFIDMDHLPSKDSLPTAIAVVSKAVEEDKKGNFKSAVKLYCEALSFFMPAIHHETNHRKKDAIRVKVKEYMDRAEVLKQMMKPTSTKTTSSPNHTHNQHRENDYNSPEKAISEMSISDQSNHKKSSSSPSHNTAKPPRPSSSPKTATQSSASSSPKTTTTTTSPSSSPSSANKTHPLSRQDSTDNKHFEELFTLCANAPELTAALKLINGALLEEQTEDYTQCLHHFEIGLGALLKLLPDEPKGRRKDLLNSQVIKWMERAEAIKSYVEIQHLDTAKGSPMLEEDSEMSKELSPPSWSSLYIFYPSFIIDSIYTFIVDISLILYHLLFDRLS